MKRQKITFLLFLLMVSISYGFSQNLTVSGVISSSADKAPVIGASIMIKGTQTGTISDLDGKYTISAPKGSTLVFSYVGMIAQEITVASSVINVDLKENAQVLDEMVVIGYGVQKRSDITGTISSVNMSQVSKMPVANLSQALQGAASGLQVNDNSGQPGSGVNIRIRGISSINGGNPMWVIDGVPGGADGVNPNDIESIEILKDASTAAIYGVNAANGVILVTTKKGSEGKLNLNFNAFYGVQQVMKQMNMADGPSFGHYMNEYELAYKTRANKLSFPSPGKIDSLPTYDYLKNSFQQAATQSYNLSLSTGKANSNVYFAINHTNQDGIINGSNYQKLNLLLNSEFKVRSWLTIGERAQFGTSERKGFPEWKFQSEYESPLMAASIFLPFDQETVVDKVDGKTYFTGDRFGNVSPSAKLQYLANENNNSYGGTITTYIKIEPIKNLIFESRLTGNTYFNESYSFQDIYTIKNTTMRNDRTSFSRNYGKSMGWGWQNFVTYSTSIADVFNVSAVAGMESGWGYSHDMSGVRYDLFSTDPNNWFFNSSTDNLSVAQIVKGGGSESSSYAYFGRLQADYKSKYLFQVIARQDKSSKFGPENRTGFFPSASVGWKFTEESFMKDINGLSFGKVRYAYGSSGNNNLDNYQYYGTASINQNYSYTFDNTTNASIGAAPTMLVNKAIHWEDIVTQNFGLDLGLFNNQLMLNFDYFTRENKGMLIRVAVPDIAGWYVKDAYHEGGEAAAFSNVGTMRNTGFEFTGSWKQVINKDLSYGIDANFTYVKNKATSIGETRYDGACRGISGNLTRTENGGPIGEFYGFKTMGIFQEKDGTMYEDPKTGQITWTMTNQPYTLDPISGNKVYAQPNAAPGDYIFQDANGDGKITEADKMNLGNPHPKYIAALTFNTSYKWLDFSMLWTGQFGQKIFNAVNAFILSEGTGDITKNLPQTYVDGHWRNSVWNKGLDPLVDAPTYPARHETATWARYDRFNSNQNFNRMSDIYIEDGSYVRLQNVQLGFTFPQGLIRALTLSDFRVYGSVSNLLTFTKYSGMDPVLNNGNVLVANVDKAGYPVSRTWTVGCSIKF